MGRLKANEQQMQSDKLSPYLHYRSEGPGYCQYKGNMADIVLSHLRGLLQHQARHPSHMVRGISILRSTVPRTWTKALGQQRLSVDFLLVPATDRVFSSLEICRQVDPKLPCRVCLTENTEQPSFVEGYYWYSLKINNIIPLCFCNS